jgi:uncharacterized RmlC-like cupin family protein
VKTTEDPAACVVIRSGETYEGKQGHTFFAGVSKESAGARALCLHVLEIPPGGRSRVHLHENHEAAIYITKGEADVWHGEGLRHYMVVRAGEFVYIPPGGPHVAVNRSDTEPIHAVVARTDPNEQESVVLLPELEGVPDAYRA